MLIECNMEREIELVVEIRKGRIPSSVHYTKLTISKPLLSEWMNKWTFSPSSDVPSALPCFKGDRNAIQFTNIFEHLPKMFLKSSKMVHAFGEFLIQCDRHSQIRFRCNKHILSAGCVQSTTQGIFVLIVWFTLTRAWELGSWVTLRNRSLYLCFSFLPYIIESHDPWRPKDSSEKITFQSLDFFNLSLAVKVQVSPVSQGTSFWAPLGSSHLFRFYETSNVGIGLVVLLTWYS